MILACTAFHSSIYLDYIVRNVFYSKSLILHGPLKGLTLTLKSFIFRPLLGFPTCWWNTLKYFGPYLEWIWTRFSMNSLQIRTCILTCIFLKEYIIWFFYRWDSFPLFLILNDYLRTDDNLKNGKFHQHLRTTFAPQVVRYVDLMESSIAQSIHKGFEKERWEIKG